MKKYLSFFILSVSLIASIYAQEEDINTKNIIDKHQGSFYVCNDFFFTFSANYEQLFKISEKINLGLRAGIGRDYGNLGYALIGEGLFVFGKSKHFFEAGFGYHYTFYNDESDLDEPLYAIMAGYRFQAPKGFMFKVYPEYMPADIDWVHFWLGFAVGYTF